MFDFVALWAHTTATSILPVEFGQVTLPLIEGTNNSKDGGFAQIFVKP